MTTHAQALPTRISPLRLVLRADAAVSFVSGVALVAGAKPIASLVGGFSPLVLAIVGALCMAVAVLMWRVAASEPLNRRFAWALAIGNCDWVIASAVILFTGWLPLTPAGWWLVLAQALAVDAVAAAQVWLLVRSK